SAGILKWFQVLLIEIKTDVAVVFAVVVIGRIAALTAPDKLGRHGVPGKGGNAGGAPDGSADAEQRFRFGMVQGVRVHEEVADTGCRQDLVQARIEGAFR